MALRMLLIPAVMGWLVDLDEDNVGLAPSGFPITEISPLRLQRVVRRTLRRTVSLRNVVQVARTNGPAYICATLDWWPETKCDYGRCPWPRGVSIEDIDLSRPRLNLAVAALAAEPPQQKQLPTAASHPPLTLRLGGSMADYVQYRVSSSDSKSCRTWSTTPTTRLGYRLFDGAGKVAGICFDPRRLITILEWAKAMGCQIAFGVAAMYGRVVAHRCPTGLNCRDVQPTPECCTGWKNSPWDGSNLLALLRKLKEAGVMPWALQFGNELNGKKGIEVSVHLISLSLSLSLSLSRSLARSLSLSLSATAA